MALADAHIVAPGVAVKVGTGLTSTVVEFEAAVVALQPALLL